MQTGDPRSRRKLSKGYARHSGLVIQMGVIIFLGAWGGTRLDARWGTEPYLALGLSLFGVGAALYLAFREVSRK